MKQYILWGVGGLVALTLLAGAIFPLMAVVTAPGRVITKTLETNNIIDNYEMFFDLNAAYTRRVLDIDDQKAMIAETTDAQEKIRLNVELSGLRQTCRDLVTRYNAATEKMNRSLFKDSDLPYQLDITYCQ